ncbi:MAG: hypothetical protein LBJ72_14995 [Dysgonamonadaceae bacterium]|jgi:hypothetical protein|nr:hypothetical protein [Dysgonamonadaceae bacterium]
MNRTNIKKQFKKAARYFRDFSIVVASIAVTLWVQSELNYRNEKKDTALYLNILKQEMEDNCIIIDNLIVTMEKTKHYIHYISAHDEKTLHQDTIQQYWSVFHEIPYYGYMYDAFEIFKTSGNMRFISDKELLRLIWGIYHMMKAQDEWIALYHQKKMEEVTKENQMEAEGKPPVIPMYNFYFTFSNKGEIESNFIQNAEGLLPLIKEALADIEKMLK